MTDADRILNTAEEITEATGATLRTIKAVKKYSRICPDDSPFFGCMKMTTAKSFIRWFDSGTCHHGINPGASVESQ